MTRTPHVHVLSLCIGLALACGLRVGLAAAVAALVAAVVAAGWSGGRRAAVLCVGLCLAGWWWGSLRLDAIDRSPLAPFLGEAGRVRVVVSAPPRAGPYRVRVQGVATRFRDAPLREPVLLELPRGRAPPQGAVLEILATLRAPRPADGGFDERRWLRRHGVHVVLRASGWRELGRRGGLGGVADRLHERLAGSISPGLTGERRALVQGVVLGDDTQVPPGLRADFRASGLYHLLSLSGCKSGRIVRCMRSPWSVVRCSLGRHRWQSIRIGAQKGRECRDCKARDFDGPTHPDLDDVKDAASKLSAL